MMTVAIAHPAAAASVVVAAVASAAALAAADLVAAQAALHVHPVMQPLKRRASDVVC
jgi:hypothetical protein